MASRTRSRACLWLAVALSTLSGCQIVSWPFGGNSLHNPDDLKNLSVSQADYGTKAANNPRVAQNFQRPVGPNDQISYLNQQLSEYADNCKVLQTQCERMTIQLDEKEKALVAASQEIQEATSQIVKTRNELQAWQREMISVRDRQSKMERDNRDTLEATIKMLEKMLEPAPRAETAPIPEVLPTPQKIH